METATRDRPRRALSILVKVLLVATLFGLALPLIFSLSPSESAKVIGQPILVEIEDLSFSRHIELDWRGAKHFIVLRSEQDIDSLNTSYPIGYYAFPIGEAYDRYLRSVRDDVFVVNGICPHKTCVVEFVSAADFDALPFDYERDRLFWDPCHGWFFDLAGRYLGESEYRSLPSSSHKPGIRSLSVPDYRFPSESVIELGRQ